MLTSSWNVYPKLASLLILEPSKMPRINVHARNRESFVIQVGYNWRQVKWVWDWTKSPGIVLRAQTMPTRRILRRAVVILVLFSSTAIMAVADDRTAAELLPPSTVIFAEIRQPQDLLNTVYDHQACSAH